MQEPQRFGVRKLTTSLRNALWGIFERQKLARSCPTGSYVTGHFRQSSLEFLL